MICNFGYYGIVGYYVNMVVEEGLIGLLLCNLCLVMLFIYVIKVLVGINLIVFVMLVNLNIFIFDVVIMMVL